MIKLFSQTLLLRSETGELTVFDQEQLRRDLAAAFAACGNHETWLAEHVALAVEERLLQEKENGAEPRETVSLLKMVFNILHAAGYPDVAADFSARRGLAAAPCLSVAGEELLPWDEQRVRQLLLAQAPGCGIFINTAAEQVLARLQSLGFSEVSNTLILQLAAHLRQPQPVIADTAQTAVEKPAAAAVNPWIVTAEQAEMLVHTEFPDIPGLVKLQPVSRLLPRVRADINLDALVTDRIAPPVPELWLLPEFRRCCRCTAEIFSKAHADVAAAVSGSSVFPAYLRLRSFDAMLDICQIPKTPVSIRDISRELAGIAENEIGSALKSQLYIKLERENA